LSIEVEALEGSGRADGRISISGFLEKTFEVQVTFAGYERSDALRSEMLAEEGAAPGAGPIDRERDTGKIFASMQSEDVGAFVKALGQSIHARVSLKIGKPYATGSILLVAFDEVRICGRGWWELLYETIDDAGGIHLGPFSGIYLFNSASNELNRVA